jgi:hypothetical protein
MHPLPQQIQKLELFFDQLHDFLCESEGNNSEISMTALKGSLYCRSLLCDLLNEQSGDE